MKYLKWLNERGLQIISPVYDKFGFVYKITQISTGKIYIGKKNFWNGDKTKPSNWLEYTTSSKILSPLIKANPSDFKAEIIQYAVTSKQLGYFEKVQQEVYGVFSGDDFNKEYK